MHRVRFSLGAIYLHLLRWRFPDAFIVIYVSHFFGMEDSVCFYLFVNADDARRSDGASAHHFSGAEIY